MECERGPRGGRKGGFTLVELLVVIAIIGLLASIVGVNVMNRMRKARQTKAMADIKNIASACDMFKIDCARYPDSLEDLNSPPADAPSWDGPYLKEAVIPLDPWGREYQYILEGSDFTVLSLGADGADGGEDENADITNHDAALGQPR